MKLYLDTNVILDLILNRAPFFDDIARIVTLYEMGKCELFTSSVSIVNCNYILGKNIDSKQVIDNLKILRSFCSVLTVSELEIDQSLNSDFKDFEDAVQYYACLKNDCNFIITRDIKDFKSSPIPAISPAEFLASIKK
ncbi:type II toxin-antitoxin system VapC family toxin [Flavobacterium foetidum]|uniref:type II toxin-antitoxin system VapC family toxin n=1 Tax=Flavobacterium foetidum TaxID=2026681 RepID=UPI001074B44A|nr:PIN domain-containing protein [Flavobacterium foetidum]KAF2509837.1 PIN domain-containing protein [Flavobacterium foetidum]